VCGSAGRVRTVGGANGSASRVVPAVTDKHQQRGVAGPGGWFRRPALGAGRLRYLRTRDFGFPSSPVLFDG
jgi:hypothetical protein